MNDPLFVWLLGYDVDTTVATSSCPYDRYGDHSIAPYTLQYREGSFDSLSKERELLYSIIE